MTDSERDAQQRQSLDDTVVFVITAANRPGMAHSIAAVFAHRGLSIDTFVSDSAREPTRILVEFSGSLHQRLRVQRALQRLHYVDELVVHAIDARELRGVVLFRLSGARKLPKLASLKAVTAARVDDMVQLSGQLRAVSEALNALRNAGVVEAASRSVIAL